jgi:hypothetical protein
MLERVRGTTITVITASALAAIGVASVATGAIPSGNGTIYACYGTGDGSVRLVEEGQSCPRNFNPITWSQQGPQGLKGDKGDKGDQGPQGPPGKDGQNAGAADLVIYSVRNDSASPIPPHTGILASVSCREGDRVLSGGFYAGLNPETNVIASWPSSLDDNARSWFVTAHNPTSNPASVEPWALCLDRTP